MLLILKHLLVNKENPAELTDGSGERVCYIINDLLNRELIKRNFRFKTPVIKDDEEVEEDKEVDREEALNTGDVVDSNSIPLHKYFKQCDALNIEDELNKNEHIETAFDDEDNEMIEPGVDPDEWNREFNRVKAYIDKDLDVQGNVFDSKSGKSKANMVNASAIDELLEKIEKVSEYYQVVKDFIYNGGK